MASNNMGSVRACQAARDSTEHESDSGHQIAVSFRRAILRSKKAISRSRARHQGSLLDASKTVSSFVICSNSLSFDPMLQSASGFVETQFRRFPQPS